MRILRILSRKGTIISEKSHAKIYMAEMAKVAKKRFALFALSALSASFATFANAIFNESAKSAESARQKYTSRIRSDAMNIENNKT